MGGSESFGTNDGVAIEIKLQIAKALDRWETRTQKEGTLRLADGTGSVPAGSRPQAQAIPPDRLSHTQTAAKGTSRRAEANHGLQQLHK